MVNRVILIGNLGKDPEVKRLESGAVVAKFSIATSESYKKSGEWQETTEWHDIVMWRDLAERAESQLKKGNRVYIEGKLTHRTWEDQDGKKRKNSEVVANYFRSLSTDRKIDAASDPEPDREPVTNNAGPDDDLPF